MTGTANPVARTTDPFAQAARDVMRARKMGVRRLAREVRMSPGHISRVLRGAQNKRPGGELVRRVTAALDLPPDYFLEARRAEVLTRLAADASLVDRVHDRRL